MSIITCTACNKELEDEEIRPHYKSEWHRYNLKRKIAGVPGITEALFLARQSAAAQESNKPSETSLSYSCHICRKSFRRSKVLDQHLKSRGHISRALQETNDQEVSKPIFKPNPQRIPNKLPRQSGEEDEESEEEWEEVNPEDLLADAAKSLTNLNVNNSNNDVDDSEDEYDDMELELDPSSCFMCDLEHDSIDSCMVHMHKQHGFFIPDVEYLKDPKGFLTYIGLKVKRDFLCLYCSDKCDPFGSLEAVRKHMAAKSHCRVHYGDGDDSEEVELEEFYDYSSSFVDESGNQLVPSGVSPYSAELGSGGAELILTQRTNGRVLTKTLGSREFLRYYRQKLRPTPANNVAITAALASRYRSMGLATVQSKDRMMRMKVMKEMNRTGVETMRTKLGLKNNVIRNLPKNVPF